MRDLSEIRSFIEWCRENGVESVKVEDVVVRFGPKPYVPSDDLLDPEAPGAPESDLQNVEEDVALWSAR